MKAHSRLHLLKSIEQPSQACGHRRSIPIKSDAKPRANLMTDGSAMRRLWAAVIWTRFYHGIHLRCPAAFTNAQSSFPIHGTERLCTILYNQRYWEPLHQLMVVRHLCSLGD